MCLCWLLFRISRGVCGNLRCSVDSRQIITPMLRSVLIDGIIVVTLVLTPTIHASYDFAVHCPGFLQRRVAGAHDGLSDVVKTVVDVVISHVLLAKG